MLYEYNSADVKTVDIKNSLDQYQIIRTGNSVWTINGDELQNVPKNDTVIKTIPVNISAVEAKEIVEKT